MIEAIYNAAFGVWNSLIEIAMTLFTTSPTAANGSVYAMSHTLFDAIADISIPVTVIFALIGIIRDVVTTPPDQQARRLVGDGLKLGIMVGIVTNLWLIMGYIIQITDGITDKMSGSSSYQMAMTPELESCISAASVMPTESVHVVSFTSDLPVFVSAWSNYLTNNIIFLVTSFATLLIVVASAISILSSAFQRIVKPLAILPFSTITVAMGTGTGEVSRVTAQYLKTFFGLCISGAFMVICVKLGAALTGNIVAFNVSQLSLHEQVIYMSIQNAITPIVVAGLIKSADSLIARFF